MDYLSSLGPTLLWGGFILVILGLLAIDLGVFHRTARTVRFREALIWCCVWVGLAMLFNLGIWQFQGSERALEFLAGYLIEQSLSVDNIFVFIMVFSFFSVDAAHQHRVLFYGILGAIVMRAVFILVGISLFEQFHWLIYIFGLLLIFTAYKMLAHASSEPDLSQNRVVHFARRFLRTTPSFHGEKFFVRLNGKLFATPLFLVLVILEGMDLMFAIDSIPAIFAITRDPFIAFTSNIFAILGLRSLFFLVAGALQ
ncbi:MAG: TerC/Alx family metal homeostasis membrane protein, partial [Proteobacteria bacterium]|nr:TerC/Alx family metal homeostasis membrane protein [Pseudomonadota bacterium]